MTYSDPAAVHNPSTGGVAPASWGDQLNANDQWFALPAQCKLYRATDQSISNTTETAVLWASEEFDTDGMHSTSSNTDRITATTEGLYRVEARIVFDVGAGGTIRRARLWKNGTSGTLLDVDHDKSPSGSWGAFLRVSADVELAAGDYVSCVVYHDAGAALNVIGNALGTSSRSWMSARWSGIRP